MREAEFKRWLQSEHYGGGTINTQLARARKLNEAYGDLDEFYKSGRLASLHDQLAYTASDKRESKPNPAKFTVEGDLYSNLASYRATVNFYHRFCDNAAGRSASVDRPNRDAVVKAIEEFDFLGRDAFMRQHHFADRNITYRVIHDGREYPSKAIFGVAHKYMPGGKARSSETCDGTEAREHLAKLGFEITSDETAGGDRPFVLFDTNGKAFQPVRNYNSRTKRSAFRLQVPGTSNKAEDAEEVESVLEVARGMLLEGRLARVQAIGGGPVSYVGYGKQKLVRYELDPRIAAQLGIPARPGQANALALDPEALERLRVLFLDKNPDFESFLASGTYGPKEDQYKRLLVSRAAELMQTYSEGGETSLGGALLDLLAGLGGFESNLLDWRIAKLVKDARAKSPGVLEQATGDLARATGATQAVAQFAEKTWELLCDNAFAPNPFAESRTIPTMLRALIDPEETLGIRSNPTDNAAKMLLGRPAFKQQPLSADEFQDVLALAQALFRVMRDEWKWAPRDLWDVQGFIWETCQKRLSDKADQPIAFGETRIMPKPTNLILFGPPGTGKTFATAAEAVRLCGEVVPGGREELMAVYQQLADAGRIEFVTFHQSVAYEDFIEGLRPTQATDDGGAGFELKPEPGVFRRISRRAETSTGSGKSEFPVAGRQIFKMSIGEAANPDDAHLFEEAIAGGYTLLGWGDIDWSDDRFSRREAIIEAVRAHELADDPNAASGFVQMPFIFRNWMKPGDIVVISKGNLLFRAIGEITGGYQFAPREEGGYAHRRGVRWMWVDRVGVPVSEIYARKFTQKAIYQLNDADLNLPALERYIASQQTKGSAGPEPFVLVIDEINRANISKVFGELITLLEPDKRLGQPNALKIRLPYSGDLFGVPSNLHVLGTMNTADRSIALLDTALRRRFDFRELMPDPSLLEPVDGVDLALMLTTLNERIEYLFDREHQIGHAYFMGCQTKDDIDDVMRHEVIPLLAEYFYEDWSKVAAVLGDAGDGEGDSTGAFIDRIRLKPPKIWGASDDAAPPDIAGSCVMPFLMTHSRRHDSSDNPRMGNAPIWCG